MHLSAILRMNYKRIKGVAKDIGNTKMAVMPWKETDVMTEKERFIMLTSFYGPLGGCFRESSPRVDIRNGLIRYYHFFAAVEVTQLS